MPKIKTRCLVCGDRKRHVENFIELVCNKPICAGCIDDLAATLEVQREFFEKWRLRVVPGPEAA